MAAPTIDPPVEPGTATSFSPVENDPPLRWQRALHLAPKGGLGAGWRAVMGETPGPDPDEALRSDLVVLWGIHAVATSQHFAARAKAARRRALGIEHVLFNIVI